MITEILMSNVACYKSEVKFHFDKKVALMYGLNGTGKSVLSNFLYDQNNPLYKKCAVTSSVDDAIFVYNQTFVKDYFHEEDSLKGIFTLSKKNKKVAETIRQKSIDHEKQTERKMTLQKEVDQCQADNASRRLASIEKVWEIKRKYSGGDRVLDYCLRNLKRREMLYEHLLSIPFDDACPAIDIDRLREEAASLQSKTVTKIDKFPLLDFEGFQVEEHSIIEKRIHASADGPISEFIQALGNSDWVKKGLDFVKTPSKNKSSTCPFCQKNTISEEFIESVVSVFDGQYKKDTDLLESLALTYERSIKNLTFPSIELSEFASENLIRGWKIIVESLQFTMESNSFNLRRKILNPSEIFVLISTRDKFDSLNEAIENVNSSIVQFNKRISDRDGSLKSIKKQFWAQMRREYNQTIEAEERNSVIATKRITDILSKSKLVENRIMGISNEISSLRGKTVSVDSAVQAINSRLSALGLEGFTIVSHSAHLYRVARAGEETNAFHSLSEGEKTLISFLYFIEMCKGTFEPDQINKNKVVIIDDPISSLSHIYLFNICQYIKREFVNSSDYKQVIVLTHSLYFFYELTQTNPEKRKELQSLFRIAKKPTGTTVLKMKYEEIQNDYQTYWSIIKDNSSPPALIANCMRNIIEYFFNFVEKRDFNNVFQKAELSDDKFQCFSRYMNRESHSLGQNIFDIKEFDYEAFKEGLELIFLHCGYPHHYTAMMK